jgi:hypothetical protein
VAEQPRALAACERLGGGLVEHELGIGVRLQEAGGDDRGDFAFDSLLDDLRLAFAEGHQQDLLGLKNGANAHRDRAARDVVLVKEIAGGVAAGNLVERDHPGAAVAA